jgi:SAM-dependent methyltransferase
MPRARLLRVTTRPRIASYDRFQDEVQAFEDAVSAQRPVAAGHYDDEYFAADWREDGSRYELETRRRIEDRNPALIKEVFEPDRVLDVGCGPGFLMLFLVELGVEVQGIDFSPSSLELAPAEVRDRILIGDVSEQHVPERSFDLAICREVLEHLTILQVRRTIEQLCRASSRFVYATTRFHPDPAGLLDVTTDLETDPTHITLLAKDFVRCLFVLEGFRRRDDLEERMDWAEKGRVLVYERSAPA